LKVCQLTPLKTTLASAGTDSWGKVDGVAVSAFIVFYAPKLYNFCKYRLS
jgi:hypothetical protein